MKKTTKTKNTTTEDAAAAQALAKAREFAEGYGKKNLIATTYREVTGSEIRNEEVTRLLKADAQNHSASPRLGRGLMIMAICSALEAGHKTPTAIKKHVEKKLEQYGK